MREIKFRAWDEGSKIMHHNFQFITSGDNGNDWILFTSDEAPYEKNRKEGVVLNNPYFRQQLKIMQFTTLHDKNGKEIWGKDRVKCTDASGKTFFGTVEFEDGCFVVVFDERQYDSHLKCYREGDYVKCFVVNHAIEVIGNIYEGE